MQLGGTPFFFKEDKEAAENIGGFFPSTCHMHVLSEYCLFEDAQAPGRAMVGMCRGTGASAELHASQHGTCLVSC